MDVSPSLGCKQRRAFGTDHRSEIRVTAMELHPTGPSVSSTVTEQTLTSGKVPLQETFTLMMETGRNSRSLHSGTQGSCVQGFQLRRLQLEPVRDTSDATNFKSN